MVLNSSDASLNYALLGRPPTIVNPIRFLCAHPHVIGVIDNQLEER